jgi:hypothetical protein
MTAPDPLNVRAYNSQVKRHQNKAYREAASIKQRLAEVTRGLDDGNVTLPLGAARNMAMDVAELVAALSALEVLADMSFLTTDPDAKEATNG